MRRKSNFVKEQTIRRLQEQCSEMSAVIQDLMADAKRDQDELSYLRDLSIIISWMRTIIIFVKMLTKNAPKICRFRTIHYKLNNGIAAVVFRWPDGCRTICNFV